CSARPAPTTPPGNRRSTRPNLSRAPTLRRVHPDHGPARAERGGEVRVPAEAPPAATALGLQLPAELDGLHDPAGFLDHPLPGRQRPALPATPALGASGVQ